jgi:hypothetical protein
VTEEPNSSRTYPGGISNVTLWDPHIVLRHVWNKELSQKLKDSITSPILTLQRPVVTICTTRLNILKLWILPT